MSKPRPKPAFTETMQIGIVVPDLEAAIRTYRDVYGIGGWKIMEMGPEDARDARVHGQPVAWKSRAATTMVGSVMWELIEPVLSGTFSGIEVDLLNTERDLGVILEVFSGMP